MQKTTTYFCLCCSHWLVLCNTISNETCIPVGDAGLTTRSSRFYPSSIWTCNNIT